MMTLPELPRTVIDRILLRLPQPVLVCSVRLLDRAACALVANLYPPDADWTKISAFHPELPLWCLADYVQSLCSPGCKPNNERLALLLQCRAAAGDIQGIELLQQHGVRSPGALIAAVKAGHIHVVEHLLFSGAGASSAQSSITSGTTSTSGANGSMMQWDRQVLCHTAARHGQLQMLQYLRLKLQCPWDAGVCAAAAAGGHLHLLQWLRAAGCAWCADTCFEAAINGHLHLLQWCMAAGCPCDAATSLAAAIKGHFEILLWLRSAEATAGRGSGGRHQLLQWLQEQGAA